MSRPSVLIVGAGPGIGAAVARRFAAEGFPIALVRRHADALAPLVQEIATSGGEARAYGADAADEAGVVRLFEQVEAGLGPVEVVIFNAAGFASHPILQTPAGELEALWRAIALGGFLVGREAARRMVPRARGTILFTGATASVKANAEFAAFASAKHALRALAQSMAKELGPLGVHVAHLVVDGIIDAPRVHDQMPELAAAKGPDGLIQPGSVADLYLWLHRQPRDAWTFELDARPFKEPW